MRFMGATFDPSALYRFLHIRRMLAGEGLTTARISARVAELEAAPCRQPCQDRAGQAELLDPPSGPARFLALRHAKAAEWQAALLAQDCVTDVRGDVLRIGLGLYHDEDDLARFVGRARNLR